MSRSQSNYRSRPREQSPSPQQYVDVTVEQDHDYVPPPVDAPQYMTYLADAVEYVVDNLSHILMGMSNTLNRVIYVVLVGSFYVSFVGACFVYISCVFGIIRAANELIHSQKCGDSIAYFLFSSLKQSCIYSSRIEALFTIIVCVVIIRTIDIVYGDLSNSLKRWFLSLFR